VDVARPARAGHSATALVRVPISGKAAWLAATASALRHERSHAKADRRQLQALRAYIRACFVAAAAYELGIGETTVRQHLSGLCRRTGCANAAQAAYWLGKGGLIG
jgi:DNA-binding NarL/FixJ family response regulator